MKNLSLSALALASVLCTAPVHADVLDVLFTGTVATQAGTSFALGSTIDGGFSFDTTSGSFLSFVVGGQSVAPGYSSSAAMTPDMFSAIYLAQLSPVTSGGNVNSSFVVDLEGVNPWPVGGAAALLSNSAALAANLDTGFSSFGFYTANADGTDVHSLSASLTSLQVSSVPEPAPATLLLAGAAAVALRRLRSARLESTLG